MKRLTATCHWLPSRVACLAVLLTIFSIPSLAETITFDKNWADQGFNLIQNDNSGLEIIYSLHEFQIEDIVIDGRLMKNILAPGIFLPNDAGAPNLPGTGRFIAIPNGANVRITILEQRTELFTGLDVAPAPKIPFENDDSPLNYTRNEAVYNSDSYYPAQPADLSEPIEMRGVNSAIVGISPFQYNPVTNELLVYKDLHIRIDFEGGNGCFGDDRLRNRHWDPILKGNLLNYESLPEVDFNKPKAQTDDYGFEYVIIVPDDPDFIAWGNTLKEWRQLQGISTGVFTLSQIGGNNSSVIDNWVINAYYTWDIPPAAVLLLSDYESSGDNYGITSALWDNYCVSDNLYADVMYDNLPDIAFARITAQNAAQLETMISKMLDYEQNPPTDPDFYNEPLIAGGWQTERWFILCTEVIYGYHYNVHGKDPHREYAIYSGTPGSLWSTNGNTGTVVNYFGPNGLGYIRSTPSYLTNWTGSAAGVNASINDGAFMLLHRDHGYEGGWGEPDYSTSNVLQLNNDKLPFVFSINCLTGKYNYGQQTFAEAFHRHQQGALGIIAASEVSYSFVNDTYVWGMWDSMWPDFDPGYGSDETGSTTLRPCFANASGKYYLQASSWPSNPGNKTVTHHLFHHHGDAFITMFSEVPQELQVTDPEIVYNTDSLVTMTADAGAVVALTIDGEIIGVAESAGVEMEIPIVPQLPGQIMTITATLQNHYRYSTEVMIIPNEPQYVLFDSLTIDDSAGNGNGLADIGETLELSITVWSVGSQTAENVDVEILSDDPYATIIDGQEYYGAIEPGAYATSTGGFTIEVASDAPDLHPLEFTLAATNGISVWESPFYIAAHAPILNISQIVVNDITGNNNGEFDPGETVDLEISLTNAGTCDAVNIITDISTSELLMTIPDPSITWDNLTAAAETTLVFENISAHEALTSGTEVEFNLQSVCDGGYQRVETFSLTIGNSMYQPTGADGYGYYAYDSYDGNLAPEFEWTEIAPMAGGSGTDLNLTSNQTVQVDLPFTFTYYGVDYDEISICSNGWLALGSEFITIPVNMALPNANPPNKQVAAFWCNLDPSVSGQVCYHHDTIENLFIIEWYNVQHYLQPSYVETFQIVLRDPAVYVTPTGDGEIVMYYDSVSAYTNYCTVGIEDHNGLVGLQYLYNANYALYAMPLESNFAVKFTTAAFVDPNAPSAFSLIAPALNDTVWTSETLSSWNQSLDPNAGWTPGYDVWLDNSPDLLSKWRIVENHSDTTYTITALEDDQTYYWSVRATDINSGGTWSDDTLSFTTFFPEPPQSFVLIEPENASVLEAGATTFRWSPAIDPDPGDEVEYAVWFVAGDDSVSFDLSADSIVVDPDSIDFLVTGEEASWYVTARSAFPEILIECEERFFFTPTLAVNGLTDTGIPREFSMQQNYPNPFNPVTTVKFAVPHTARVTIRVFDILGRQTLLLTDTEYSAGYYTVNWDAASVSSGIYFIKMESASFSRTIKTLLVK